MVFSGYLPRSGTAGPQDEAGLTREFETEPRGLGHLPKDPDFPILS